MDHYEAARAAAGVLAERTGIDSHDVAVVTGSGWSAAVDALGVADRVVPMAELPDFAAPTVPGHTAELRSIEVDGRRVLAVLGRVHGYEGHSPAAVVHAVRAAVFAGCRTVVLTNAAGALRPELPVGAPVLIADHLNLTGASPLTGPSPDESIGPRFPDLSDVYSRRLRALARDLAPDLAEGVYAGVAGPQYETPAEVRMLAALGADLVGMSTVHEAIAAAHLGAEVLGISLVTNLAAGLGAPLAHADVLRTASRSVADIGALLARIVPRL